MCATRSSSSRPAWWPCFSRPFATPPDFARGCASPTSPPTSAAQPRPQVAEPDQQPAAAKSKSAPGQPATKAGTGAETETTPAPDNGARTTPRTKAERQLDRERRKSRDRIARKIGSCEEQIHAREKASEQLDWKLGDPAVYSDAEALTSVQAEQAELRGAIDDLYAEWERLSDELAALDDLIE